MKHVNTTFSDFTDNHLEELISEHIKYLFEMGDEAITFINHFIFEELNFKIPIHQDTGNIVNVLNEEDENYYDIDLYGQDTNEVSLENSSGFDFYNDNVEEFMNVYSEEFKQWLNNWLIVKVDEIAIEIFDKIENNEITIYRGMGLDKNYLELLNNNQITELGSCWTIDINIANDFTHGKDTQDKVILTGSIHEIDIDWVSTFNLNLSPSLGEDEKEIRLWNNSLIHLKHITINNNEDVEINKLYSADKIELPHIEKQIEEEYNNKDNNGFSKELINLLRDNNYNSLSEFLSLREEYNKKSKQTSNFLKIQNFKPNNNKINTINKP